MKKLIIKSVGSYLNVLACIAPKYAAKTGFFIFCRPFRIPFTQKQKDFLDTAEKFIVKTEEGEAQGYKWGNGSKNVLFIHGWQSHSYRWKAYVEALPKNEYTVYALDAPGHGLSKGEFLSIPLYSTYIYELMLQVGKWHAVIGHSLGSFAIVYTLYSFPELPVQRIILTAPPGEAIDFINLFKETLGLTHRTIKLVVNYFAKTYNVSPDYFSTKKFVASLNIPGLIIHDEEDDEAPYKYAAQIQGAWKNSQLITTKGFGHNLRSASVVKDVVNFLEQPMSRQVIAENSIQDF